MCIINSSKWKSALRWRALNDEFGERTPLKLLISQMPGLLTYDSKIVIYVLNYESSLIISSLHYVT